MLLRSIMSYAALTQIYASLFVGNEFIFWKLHCKSTTINTRKLLFIVLKPIRHSAHCMRRADSI